MTRHFSFVAAVVLGAVLFQGGNSAFAQRKSDAQTSSSLKNNSRILDLFKSPVAKAAESTVTVWIDGKQVALGTIVKADGFILTKNSELQDKNHLPRKENIVVKFKTGKDLPATKISADESWDLAVLKVEAADLKPVVWADSKVDPVGNWVATAAPADKPFAVGIVSVAPRTIPGPKISLPKNFNDRGFLGIRMAPDEKKSGVKISEVTLKSPADKAGLKANDIIVAVDGIDTPDSITVSATIGRHKPGETITIRYRRGDKEDEAKATLGRPPADSIDRGDLQNGSYMGTDRSERRTGFPNALQHDTDLKAAQCGGPLVDLEGRVIGINIARGSRTDTFALPSEAIKPILAQLLAAKVAATPWPSNKSMTDKIKAAEALVKEADALRVDAEKKLTETKASLEKFQNELKSVINNAEKLVKEPNDSTVDAEKKLADAKAALEKIQDKYRPLIKDKEDAKSAADKKLADAKAAYDKLQSEVKKESAK